MEKNYSKQIRNNFIKKFASSSFFYSLDEFVNAYEQYIYLILDTDIPSFQKLEINMELVVAFSDLYKILMYKRNQNILTTEDYFYIAELDEVLEQSDLIPEISAVPALLEKSLKAMFEFRNMSFLGKQNIMRNLNADDHNYLSMINPFHEEEKNTYLREITLDDYIKHIESKVGKLSLQNDFSVMPEHFIEEICGFIKDLSKSDYENCANNIKDLLIFYYEYAKYTIDHNKKITQGSEDDNKYIVEAFETMSLENLVEEILYNHDFMYCLVDYYVNTYPLKEVIYEDGNVDTKEVEAYVESIEDEKIKQKLKYKKTRI